MTLTRLRAFLHEQTIATLVGVKYGKAAVGGLIAVALLVLKKGGFLLLAPIVWIGARLRRKTLGRGPASTRP